MPKPSNGFLQSLCERLQAPPRRERLDYVVKKQFQRDAQIRYDTLTLTISRLREHIGQQQLSPTTSLVEMLDNYYRPAKWDECLDSIAHSLTQAENLLHKVTRLEKKIQLASISESEQNPQSYLSKTKHTLVNKWRVSRVERLDAAFQYCSEAYLELYDAINYAPSVSLKPLLKTLTGQLAEHCKQYFNRPLDNDERSLSY